MSAPMSFSSKRTDFATSAKKREKTGPAGDPAPLSAFLADDVVAMEDEEHAVATAPVLSTPRFQIPRLQLVTPASTSTTTPKSRTPLQSAVSSTSTTAFSFSSSSPQSTPQNRLSLLPNAILSRLESDFVLHEQLGQGNFGSVIKAQHRLDQTYYAIKMVSRGKRSNNSLALKELRAHCALNHSSRHLVHYHTSWFDASERVLHIQLELCDANLLEIKPMLQAGALCDGAKEVIVHIASALAAMHALNFCHLDCKSANILLAKNSASHERLWKLGDLGHCTELSPTTGMPLTEVLDGDFTYASLEVVNDDYDFLKKADVFALGISAYELFLPGRLPEKGEEWTALREGKLSTALPVLSPALRALLLEMMDCNVETRLDVTQVLQRVQSCVV